jgi:hypothetical protein
LTGPPSVSIAPSSDVNQPQTNHSRFEDVPLVNTLANSFHDDPNDPYVPSGGDDESDNESDISEQASQISNSEVCFSNIII